ncbi:MAG: metalloprotease TldD [Myxococcales bacterium]|nr:metalloprotease TldD [Myxococcales bacterium]MCB9520242.1 metalloprotease TldD [Myxococcales bacterium]MCB9531390.1 metalloprotease TldD [Myxococcales bacterium]MCB9533537.1 metalloprotease TldD [Myxococcales bacterium]
MTTQTGDLTVAFRRFSTDTETAARVLSRALARGGDFADLFFERRETGLISLDQQRVEDVERAIHLGVGVRVLAGDATGYAYTEDLSTDGLYRAADTAAAIARGGGAHEAVAAETVATPSLYPIERSTFDAAALDKLALLRRADEAARAYDARVTRVTVTLVESVKDILIVTSDGRVVTDHQPMLRFTVGVVAEEGSARQSANEGGGGRVGLEYFDAHSPEDAGREAARIATTMLHAAEAPAGQLPVVLGAGDSGILLHEAIGHGLEADFNRKKTSNYSGRVGERVASELCTIVDDGTIPSSRGSINVDDEGNLPSRNVLIEDGILRGYLHDHLSRQHFGLDPSGNGRRQDYQHVPLPRMTNTYMLAGPHDPEEIIASVERGIYARSFSGGQVNISNGDFVFSVTEGYLIEGGRITAPVKGVNLIGNGPDCLGRVTMCGTDFELSDGRWTCGKDGQSVPVGVGIPTVKISSMTVGGSRT